MKYIKSKKFLSVLHFQRHKDHLNKIGVPCFKIGSGECNNYPLVEYIAKFKKTNNIKYRYE